MPSPSIVTTPASPISSSVSPSRASAGTSRPSIRVCVALPPAPCAMVTVSSLNRGRFERAVSMIRRTFCSRSTDRWSSPPIQTSSFSRAKRP